MKSAVCCVQYSTCSVQCIVRITGWHKVWTCGRRPKAKVILCGQDYEIKDLNSVDVIERNWGFPPMLVNQIMASEV